MNFAELAVLATEIHKNHYKLQKDFTGALPVISNDENVSTYYSYVQNALKFKDIKTINIYKLEYEEKFILGRYQKYTNSVDIWIANRISTCWKRYVTVKELSHILVDKQESSHTLDINSTILWMVQEGMKKGVSDALDSEHIAAQLAIEILLPYKQTQSLLQDDTIESSEIAETFKVPLYIVQSIRKVKEDGTSYLNKRDEAYKDLDIEHEIIPPQ